MAQQPPIHVERGIPMPPRKARYPWASLEVGDSFLIPDKTTSQICGSRAWAELKLPGRKFSARKEGLGTRVWRIK